ncbi:hypothetical protein CONPUDRAFT_61519 [Coniophora puteana RWD-64-598 SS2]|uniref:MutL C-terminal dimerisation domain-containing protein n=1 Tax=Coniophora puteana (strain RWD-64-598) TaxID=741705 RepID=A0A5M3MGX4_CONPW|nr:uncharacterized protein CONPUDRAFT_61519 [Coniophora puteana RWD-64-598 SS2]EIW78024.1 hypothetical protein CONPUDRAFT_61519 [Coniophora puteana RWD-64-598 SS2]
MPSGDATFTIRFDLGRIASRWNELAKDDPRHALVDQSSWPLDAPTPQTGQTGDSTDSEAAGLDKSVDDAKASATLSRIIRKSDFGEMEILGQFNLGFIVARRRALASDALPGGDVDGGGGDPASAASAGSLDDLFIVDQHAADEKYNFETLQQTTNIQSQKLFRPQPLELTAADELLAMENIDVLRQNGFEVDHIEDPEAASGSRLCLVAQPVSKSTVFDMRDLEEIIHLMQDRPKGTMVRCSKARAMFAMRACRKSIMVGKPLTQAQMTTVVRHMGTMDQPWNCPHGRPTMRHLVDVQTVKSKMGCQARPIQWGAFMGSEAVVPF